VAETTTTTEAEVEVLSSVVGAPPGGTTAVQGDALPLTGPEDTGTMVILAFALMITGLLLRRIADSKVQLSDS